MMCIPIGNRAGLELYAKVDDEEFDRLSVHRWQRVGDGYASTTIYEPGGKGKLRRTLLMHRLVAQTPEGMFTDHINGDILDNRLANLRVCTKSQNCMNHRQRRADTPPGVQRSNRGSTWVAWIGINGKRKYLGSFKTKDEAIACRKAAEPIFHGEFAKGVRP